MLFLSEKKCLSIAIIKLGHIGKYVVFYTWPKCSNFGLKTGLRLYRCNVALGKTWWIIRDFLFNVFIAEVYPLTMIKISMMHYNLFQIFYLIITCSLYQITEFLKYLQQNMIYSIMLIWFYLTQSRADKHVFLVAVHPCYEL